jgi:DNA-binding HxlR family transcriptional regulator
METDQDRCDQVLGILGMVGDKWTIPVVGQLGDRMLRFGELQRALPGISQRMLTLTLRRLERDGLVSRTVHPTVPPKVEYTLTELGLGLRDSAAVFGRWAEENRAQIMANRALGSAV